MDQGAAAKLVGIILLVFVTIFILCGVRRVDALEMCLQYNLLWESVEEQVLDTPGLRMRTPWMKRICFPNTNRYVYWRKNAFEVSEDDVSRQPLGVRTNDGLGIYVEMEFAYKLLPHRLRDLYMLTGERGFQRELVHLAEGMLDNEATRFTAQEFFEDRTMIQNEFQSSLATQLESTLGIQVTTLQLQPAHFPNEYSQAITETQVATQDILVANQEQKTAMVTKETEKLRAKKLAEQQVVSAQAQAANTRLSSNAHMDQYVNRQGLDAEGYQAIYKFFGNADDFMSYLHTLALAEHNQTRLAMRLATP